MQFAKRSHQQFAERNEKLNSIKIKSFRKAGSLCMDMEKEITIIFLDIDGVLFDTKFYRTGIFNGHDSDVAQTVTKVSMFEQTALELLSKLINLVKDCLRHDVGIVISSNWRTGNSLKDLITLFSQYDFSKYIVGKTPEIHQECRGEEISQWLQNNSNVSNYVIFDDRDDIGLEELHGERFIRTIDVLRREQYERAAGILLR